MHVERGLTSGRAEQKAPRAPAGTLRCRARTCAPPQSLLISFTVNKYPQPAYIRCTQRVSATHIRQWASTDKHDSKNVRRTPAFSWLQCRHSFSGGRKSCRENVCAGSHTQTCHRALRFPRIPCTRRRSRDRGRHCWLPVHLSWQHQRRHRGRDELEQQERLRCLRALRTPTGSVVLGHRCLPEAGASQPRRKSCDYLQFLNLRGVLRKLP